MSYRKGMSWSCATLVFAVTLGCNGPANPTKKESPPAPPKQEKAQAEQADPKISEAMSALSPEDRAAAEKQRVCLVSDEPLGSMGKPYKVTVKGRTVFLCCAMCEEDLQKDPDKFLAKLKSAEAPAEK